MSTSGQEVYRLLYERTPIWLTSLGALSGSGGQRKSLVMDGLETPELSAHVATTLDTAFSTAFDSIATERGHADTSQAGVSTNLTQPSSGPISKVASNKAAPATDRVCTRSPDIPAVLYNAEAQQALYEVVKDVSKVAYSIKKCRQRSLLEDTLKKLNEASDMCEDGAFQMLREGHCRRHAYSASTIFEDLFRVSCREVMHEQLSARLGPRHSEALSQQPIQPKLNSPGVPQVEIDSGKSDDGDTIEVPLQPIRLTSHLAR